jgi:small subunit ribosomal protein S29e
VPILLLKYRRSKHQLRKMKKQLHSHPRKFGKDSRGCRVTAGCQGLIRKYGINMSRRAFREQAELIGFNKYR